MMGWAIFQYDKDLREDRLVAVYLEAADANADALVMSNADQQPTVQPFTIHETQQYGPDDDEPVSVIFDTVVNVR